MNKLKLDLDQLTVESFDTDASGIARRGTVRAHSEFCLPTHGQETYVNTCDTCANTCGNCGGSCDPTCNTCFTNCDQMSCGVIICP